MSAIAGSAEADAEAETVAGNREAAAGSLDAEAWAGSSDAAAAGRRWVWFKVLRLDVVELEDLGGGWVAASRGGWPSFSRLRAGTGPQVVVGETATCM